MTGGLGAWFAGEDPVGLGSQIGRLWRVSKGRDTDKILYYSRSPAQSPQDATVNRQYVRRPR